MRRPTRLTKERLAQIESLQIAMGMTIAEQRELVRGYRAHLEEYRCEGPPMHQILREMKESLLADQKDNKP